MTSEERHEARYQRRKAARYKRRYERCAEIGGLPGAFAYHKLHKAGMKCCCEELWKFSVQQHRAHLFSGTAVKCRRIKNKTYRFSPYNRFPLQERGKLRIIDAPRVGDRQTHKTYNNEVLQKLYFPHMIYNNGASVKGKGLAFSRKVLIQEIAEHFRKYGFSGDMILTDGKGFFPNADHDVIYATHRKYILEDGLREFGDAVIATVPGGKGVPLGVEPSQSEMIEMPSPMDQHLKCQLSLRGHGHYMDDFATLIPPGVDKRFVLREMRAKAEGCKITLNDSKTRVIHFGKNFTYCKARYHITETGRIVVRANKQAVPRDRRKIKAFREKIEDGTMGYMDLWASMNGMMAYLEQFDEHKNVLRLRRLFYALFGFSCEKIENFTEREKRMNYITFRKFKRDGLDGPFNLHPGKKVEERNGVLYRGDRRICVARSREGKLHFARNDDGRGQERGELTSAILETLAVRDAGYQERWDKVWDDATCQPYRRLDQPEGVWLWNDEFFMLDIETLEYIAALVGAEKGD